MNKKQSQSKGERGIWQCRHCEHLIRDESDFSQHIDYDHINPVNHGLVPCVADELVGQCGSCVLMRRTTGVMMGVNQPVCWVSRYTAHPCSCVHEGAVELTIINPASIRKKPAGWVATKLRNFIRSKLSEKSTERSDT